jgi:tubulin alpha
MYEPYILIPSLTHSNLLFFSHTGISIHLGQVSRPETSTGSFTASSTAFRPMVPCRKRVLGTTDDSFNTFFSETQGGVPVPSTSIWSPVCDEVRSGPYRQLYHPRQIISRKMRPITTPVDTTPLAREIGDLILDRIRKLADGLLYQLQGFLHATGGGTGSDLEVFLERLSVVTVAKSSFRLHFSVAWCQPLSLSAQLSPLDVEHTDCTFCLDNEPSTMCAVATSTLSAPTYTNLNRLIARVISRLQRRCVSMVLNVDVTEVQTNLVPYPRIHFMLTSYAPVISEGVPREPLRRRDYQLVFQADQHLMTRYVTESTHGMLPHVPCCYLRDVKTPQWLPSDQAYHSVWTGARPVSSAGEISYQPPACVPGGDLAQVRSVPCAWLPTRLLLPNALRIDLDLMYAERTFVHWYVGEGMEETEGSRKRVRIALERLRRSWCRGPAEVMLVEPKGVLGLDARNE